MQAEQKHVFHALNQAPDILFRDLKTPCYIIDEKALLHNASIFKRLKQACGCKILLAQKAFSNYDFYPLLASYLDGSCASGLYEAKLANEYLPTLENHVFACAYKTEEFDELLKYCDHFVFNSLTQLQEYGKLVKAKNKQVGLRINPQHSTQQHAIYDPCSKTSRFGVTIDILNEQINDKLLSYIDGLHFHTLCEQNADALYETFQVFEHKFKHLFPNLKWLNLGGGHHITRHDYDLNLLIDLINHIKNTYGLEVYLEPGEAHAYNAGYLATRVLDIVDNGFMHIAILDVSPSCHMVDVIEMPYQPCLYQASKIDGFYPYLLAGNSCLSGDNIGKYYFMKPLKINDLLLFGDMAIYSSVKNNTFNGIALPNIYKRQINGELIQLTNFNYEDFKYRLGTKKR